MKYKTTKGAIVMQNRRTGKKKKKVSRSKKFEYYRKVYGQNDLTDEEILAIIQQEKKDEIICEVVETLEEVMEDDWEIITNLSLDYYGRANYDILLVTEQRILIFIIIPTDKEPEFTDYQDLMAQLNLPYDLKDLQDCLYQNLVIAMFNAKVPRKTIKFKTLIITDDSNFDFVDDIGGWLTE